MGSFARNKQLPVGWYADPDHTGGYRWWDGSAWTALVVDHPPNLAA
jgi:Protein of unknown function (DUF2510)